MARSRLTLDLSPRMDKGLASHAGRHGISKTAALRRALSLLFAVDDAKEDGLHVGAWKESGGTRTEREFVIPA